MRDFRFWRWKRDHDDDVDREIDVHLALEVEEQLDAGVSTENAKYAAQRALGNVTLLKEELKEMKRATIRHLLSDVSGDLRYGVRGLVRSPGFTAVAVLSLALGIGANVAIFSVVDAVLLRPLPYPASDQIVSFAWPSTTGTNVANVTPLTFKYWHDHAQAFDGFAAVVTRSLNVVSDSLSEPVRAAASTADFFRVIGVFPLLGRSFAPDEGVQNGPRVVVISNGFWQRAFGGRSDAIGKTLMLGERQHTVVGVMPQDFAFEPNVDLIYPLQLRPDARDTARNYTILARLHDGVTLEQAQSEADRLFEAFRADNRAHVPQNIKTVRIIRFQDFLVAGVRVLLLVLMGAVGLILMIACGNVANLLLTRSTARQKEIAIRGALGASTIRLIRQAITESLLLASAGGLLGMGIAMAAVRSLTAWVPGELPRLGSVTVDARVLSFAFLISIVVGVVFGSLGVLRLLHSQPISTLKAGAGTGIDRQRRRFSDALIVGEVALSVVLMIGAGLLISTFRNLRETPTGFDPNNLVTSHLQLSPTKFGSRDSAARLDRELIESVGAIPGIASVTTASSIPFERGPNVIFAIEGESAEQVNPAELRAVGPNYFRTLGIQLRIGRELTASDSADGVPVVVVNEALSKLLGGPTTAVGRRVIIGRTTPSEDVPREVVGVVADIADGRPGTRVFPTLYIARSQYNGGLATAAVIARTHQRVEIAAEMRRAISSVNADLPITQTRWLNDVAATALAQQRFNMMLIGLFAGVASLLTMVGLYGLLSYEVAQRTRDIGLRMAIGAQRGDVMRMILARGCLLTSVGLIIGVGGALTLVRFLKTLLFGVSPTSPEVFIAVAVVLFAASLLASFIPARRAMGLDPLIALRHE